MYFMWLFLFSLELTRELSVLSSLRYELLRTQVHPCRVRRRAEIRHEFATRRFSFLRVLGAGAVLPRNEQVFRDAAKVAILLHFFAAMAGLSVGEIVVLAGPADPASFRELKAAFLRLCALFLY